MNAAKRIAAAVVLGGLAALVAFGGAGIVAAMNNVPGTAARADMTWASDQAADAKLDVATDRLADLTDGGRVAWRRPPARRSPP